MTANSIHYFNRLPATDLEDEFAAVFERQARCATTGLPWQPDFEGAEIEMVLRFCGVTL